MLRIWRVSGEELAAIPAQGLTDVRSLKHHLQALYGFPVFLQQLLHECHVLGDDAKLDALSELQIVLRHVNSCAQRRSVSEMLIEAAGCNRVGVARFLLEVGADIGRSALRCASDNGHVEVVSLLLQARADANARSMPRKPRVPWQVGLLQATLSAELGLDSNDGSTALMMASSSGHTEITHLLLDAGADTDLMNIMDKTALILACEHGHLDTARLLLSARADMDAVGVCSNTALITACDRGHVGMVNLLLGAGADSGRRGFYGKTALMAASDKAHVNIVKALLDAGADADLTNDFGCTALIWAADKGHDGIVQLLLEACAGKDKMDRHGETALMRACRKGHMDAARLLLAAGAGTTLRNTKGDTAFVLAAGRGHTCVARLLLLAGGGMPGASRASTWMTGGGIHSAGRYGPVRQRVCDKEQRARRECALAGLGGVLQHHTLP